MAWLGVDGEAPIWAWVCSAWLGLTVSMPIWACVDGLGADMGLGVLGVAWV